MTRDDFGSCLLEGTCWIFDESYILAVTSTEEGQLGFEDEAKPGLRTSFVVAMYEVCRFYKYVFLKIVKVQNSPLLPQRPQHGNIETSALQEGLILTYCTPK